MVGEQAPPAGPDLTQGVGAEDFTGETLLGHVGDQDVLLVKYGAEILAIDAQCSHYHGPLADGLVVGRQHPLPLASCLLRFAHRRGDRARRR